MSNPTAIFHPNFNETKVNDDKGDDDNDNDEDDYTNALSRGDCGEAEGADASDGGHLPHHTHRVQCQGDDDDHDDDDHDDSDDDCCTQDNVHKAHHCSIWVSATQPDLSSSRTSKRVLNNIVVMMVDGAELLMMRIIKEGSA